MIKIKSVEIYSNDEKKRVPPKYATRRDVYILDGMDITEHFVERGNWESESKEAYIIKYDRDATEEFREEEHPREEDGKFTDKGGGVGKKAKTRRRRKSRSKTPKYIPKKYDTPFSWRDTSKPLSSKQKFNYRSRKHDIKTYRSKGKNYPQTIHISDETNPELVKIFTDFWNTDPSVKAMIKHINYLGLVKQKNPKWGGVWFTDDKKIIIYDYPSQTPPYFKSTIVHEIVGHTFWDLAREWYRSDLIEFNELANKMPPVNQYCKDGLEKHGWKEINNETNSQLRALDRKYGIKEDKYGDAYEEQLWGDNLKKYEKELNEINDGKFIGNPSNEFMNRDSSSMTKYANEQHSAITEMMYDTLKDSVEKGADRVLIGNEDFEKMKVLWLKLHPKFPQKSGESWNPFNEAFVEDEHPRGQPDNAGQFVSKGGGSSKDAIHGEKVKKYEATLDIEQKKEDVDKAVNIESKVIGGVYDFIKDKSYKDKIKWVETQGSFAKGTDLGSSDLDIFIGFDYSLSIDEIQEITLDIGKNVLNPISDSGKYKIKHGADKDYPESYVDGIEVQIIGTSDVTLDQIRKGFDEGGMKTATDRTPHHTRFMKKALKGKEQEVRKLKRFFKDSGVYDSSMAKQGFSGFSTEVLIHNLGSFAKVIGYFANFVKGSVVGNTDRKFNTPLVMVDPLDPNRNLASAFSHSEKDGNIAPNKNLGRLIKSAKSLVKTGKLPKITKEKLPSVSVSFHVDNTIDNNEVFGQLYSSALSMSATLKRNGYIVKSPKDKITKDFTVDVPRINVDYDEDSGKATLNFALDNFDKKYRYVGGISEDLSDDKLKAFYDNHKGEKLVKKNGRIYAEQENEYPTAESLMKAIVSGEKKNSTVGKLERYIKQAVISKKDMEYENITDKPSSTESLSKILNTNDYIKEDDVRQLAKDLLEAEGY